MKDRGAVTVDFNNYLLPGIYWYNGDPAVKNSPGSVAGNLEVIVTSSYVIHRITVYDRTHTRRYNGTVWTDWASYLTNADISDSGWKKLTLTSDFKLYTNSSARYRKIGKLVELRGVIAPIKSISADSLTVAFTLPSGYRPSSLVSEICQGSDSNRWLLSIEASGNAVVSRYGITGYITIPTTAWLPFHAVYYTE